MHQMPRSQDAPARWFHQDRLQGMPPRHEALMPGGLSRLPSLGDPVRRFWEGPGTPHKQLVPRRTVRYAYVSRASARLGIHRNSTRHQSTYNIVFSRALHWRLATDYRLLITDHRKLATDHW